jgi:hypothetical protein
MIKRLETPGDVALDEPVCPVPDIHNLLQSGVAAPSGTETMGVLGELDVVVRVQQHAHHLGQQFIRPRWQPQRPSLPVLLRDIDTAYRVPSPPLTSNGVDDLPDLCQGHALHSLPGDPRRHRTCIRVQLAVGHQIQLGVEQLPIQSLKRQTTPAALAEDTQHRFGALQFRIPPGSLSARIT